MKKIISVSLAFIMLFTLFVPCFAEAKEYKIVSPYEDVVWSGDGAWGAYKGNLHAHSTASDADVDFNETIMEYYRQGFDFLAMTDHAVTGKPWNEQPTFLPLYAYQYIIGNKVTPLTDEEFEGVQNGTWPVDGAPRGKGMVCVTGGNELNGLTVTKCHVNGFFNDYKTGNNHLGYENNHECAVKLANDAGADSFINHPGDWLGANSDRSVYSDPENIKYFSDIILKYEHCLGMEVFNEVNSVTPNDRILWDNLLMACLPYGKTVIAFSNSDAHVLDRIDTCFMEFMMEENTVENIKATMENGAFFCVARVLPADEKFGPAQSLNVRNSGLPYPQFTELSVDGHSITVSGRNCYNIQFVADGEVIASENVTASADAVSYTLDLDTVENIADKSYVRCQLLGEGGCTLSQALVIDDGSEKLTYVPDTSAQAEIHNIFYRIASLRVFVIIKALGEIIVDKIKDLGNKIAK